MRTDNVEELVEARTEDNLDQTGLLIEPRDRAPHPILALCTHGAGVNFYHAAFVGMGREAARRGVAFLTGNNRGHDIGTVLGWSGWEGIPGGVVWEDFAESPLDIAAWVGFAVERGYRGVALIGHSFGGMKVTYYQALRQDPRVIGLGIASANVTVNLNPELLAIAERMVSEGRGLELLPWGRGANLYGRVGTYSAANYLSRSRIPDIFGASSDDPLIASIRCPIFACYGTDDIGGEAELDLMRSHARNAPRFETQIFEGANHGYMGKEALAGAAVAQWVLSL